MKRKNIDAMHEIRMMIAQVIIPTTLGAIALDKSYPNLKYVIKEKVNKTFSKKPKCRIIKFEKKEVNKEPEYILTDAIDYIAKETGLTSHLIKAVLDADVDYMKSVGIIKES